MKARRKGDIAELRACCWLFEQGWEAFLNVSAVGYADLVGIDPDGNVHKIDVKTVTKGTQHKPHHAVKRTYPKLTAEQERMGVKALYVDDDWIGWSNPQSG